MSRCSPWSSLEDVVLVSTGTRWQCGCPALLLASLQDGQKPLSDCKPRFQSRCPGSCPGAEMLAFRQSLGSLNRALCVHPMWKPPSNSDRGESTHLSRVRCTRGLSYNPHEVQIPPPQGHPLGPHLSSQRVVCPAKHLSQWVNFGGSSYLF